MTGGRGEENGGGGGWGGELKAPSQHRAELPETVTRTKTNNKT